ncbi:MAG: class I SAM-dependent methyltransferase [Bacteroidota bacterium]
MEKTLKEHWEKIYSSKKPDEVSWTEKAPATSLRFIHSFQLSKSANIIDIGGGESLLVDYLLQEGFHNITVLDISAEALERAKQRLGEKAKKVRWIVSDILQFEPDEKYDLWHDRFTFHFMTTNNNIQRYLDTAIHAVLPGGFMTVGTFSEQGPDRCSGLHTKQYTEETLTAELQKGFEKIRCITEDHITPFQTIQNFLFCSFKRKPMEFKMTA